MNKMTDTVDIARLPSISGRRNQFNYSKKRYDTCNVGEICPIYFNMLIEPGDTISLDIASLIRTPTLKFPPYDNLIAEVFAFSYNYNDLYIHANEVMGENRTGVWTPTVEYSFPKIKIPEGKKVDTHHILGHLAWPIQTGNYAGAKMGVDMYNAICNEYFNNTTVMPPVLWSNGDEDVIYDGKSLTGGELRKAAKMPDYFNAGVPAPQRGGAVNIPFVQVPVVGNGMTLGLTDGGNNYGLQGGFGGGEFLNAAAGNYGKNINTPNVTPRYTGNKTLGITTDPENSGLVTDTQAAAIALNAIRTAAVQQQIFEADGYFGSHARDIVKSRWGVTTSAETLHIPEFLGYSKFNLETYQVAQTSENTTENYVGDLGGYSQTGNIAHLFTKSFDFWACIMIMIVIRQEQHTYAQGLPAQFSKFRRFDFHWPEMEHLGFTPTYNREIYMTGVAQKDDGVFNYRPIFQEYRYERDEACGEFNPSFEQSLDYQLYVDDYDKPDGSVGTAPVFSAEWVEETPDNVDRTLQYNHKLINQIHMAHKFKIRKTSKLAQYGYPGLTRF